MSNEWYYLVGPTPQGPVTRRDILTLMQEGRIGSQTLLWQEGWPEWLPLEQTSILPTPPPAPGHLATPPPPPGEFQRLPPRSRSTTPAPLIAGGMILALLLGICLQWLFSSLLTRREVVSQPKPTSSSSIPRPSTPSALPSDLPPPSGSDSQLPTGLATGDEGATGGLNSPSLRPVLPPQTETSTPTAPADVGTPTAPSPSAIKLNPDSSTSSRDGTPTTSPMTTPPPPARRKAYTVFQEVEIQRVPQFSIAGQVFGQDLRYKLLSEIQVSQPDDRGRRTIDQVIIETRLVSADEMSKASLEKSLRELKGWQFSATLNSHGEVIEWEAGPKAGRTILDVNPLDLEGFLVTHVMDEDGWKEITQLSFFRPDPAALQDNTWKHQMTHDFGALGHWSGMTSYRRGEEQEGLTLFNYAHELEYFPPTESTSDLPFKIVDVELVPKVAGGVIYYDEPSDRVAGVKETFVVQGNLKVELLGQLTDLATSEQQSMAIMLTPENPWSDPK